MRTVTPTRERKNIEYKQVAGGEIKAVEGEVGIISGYLNKTGILDLGCDISEPGCFKQSIKDAYARRAQQGGQQLWPLLWNHDTTVLPPGSIISAHEDKTGLFIKARLNLDYSLGADIYSSAKAGTIRGLSMGYHATSVAYSKDAATGKTARHLQVVDVVEGSPVVFAMNTDSFITDVKGNAMNMLAVRGKDFDSRYQAQQLDDWQYDDWSDVSQALRQSIQDLFGTGVDPMQALETDVLPGLLSAIRAYVQAGIDLGYTGSSSSDYGMMSMSGASGESKSGYLTATSHAKIKEASTMIMKHAKIVASELSALESRNARTRANQLQGYPVYSNASAPSYFEEKEAEEDINLQLKLINTRLQVDAALREGKEALIESTPSPTAGVERALARLIESTRR